MDTVALINRLSSSYSEGRPFEFTVTPLLNVPLGRLKSRSISKEMLTKEQLAVYYAAYRHLAKMAQRDGYRDARGNLVSRALVGGTISLGASLLLRTIEKRAIKAGVKVEKIKEYGLENLKEINSLSSVSRA